jgi:fluoride exporter
MGSKTVAAVRPTTESACGKRLVRRGPKGISGGAQEVPISCGGDRRPGPAICAVFRFFGVAGAGAAGALARYWIGMAVGVRSFPWATLGINVAGSFALGLVLTAATERSWSDNVTVPVAIGFLGAFTTFSTFSYETQVLFRTDRPAAALGYVALSVVCGVVAGFAGYAIARAFG